MSTHIMVDIETLGVDNAPPVLQIAAMEFDLDTGTVYETFNQVADITSLKNVSMDTLDWWLRTAPMVLSELSQKGEETEKELICNFVQWLNTKIDVFLWGNGILFDKATIILNSNENIDDKFRRFSLIHELGHLITGKYNVQSNVDKKKTKFILSSHIDYALSHISEKEYADEFLLNEEIANIFALRVLLPLKPLLVEITKLKDLKKVAAHFGVPEEAVNSRLNLEG